MNSKAKAEGRKCSGYLCYEAERAAACMTLCLPHTLVEVRAGLRGEGALFLISSFIYSTGGTVVAPAAGNLVPIDRPSRSLHFAGPSLVSSVLYFAC